jgi:hypothetical protein
MYLLEIPRAGRAREGEAVSVWLMQDIPVPRWQLLLVSGTGLAFVFLLIVLLVMCT